MSMGINQDIEHQREILVSKIQYLQYVNNSLSDSHIIMTTTSFIGVLGLTSLYAMGMMLRPSSVEAFNRWRR